MESIFQHFRKDEQPFIEMVLGWIQDVEDLYVPKLTDFLNPRERYIVRSLIGNRDLLIAENGQFQQAERKRMLLYPTYYELQEDDFRTTVFRVKYPTKFVTLTHPHVLGSLMGLGIDRSKFGDIRIEEEEVQFAVVEELEDYMRANFTEIGKSKISIEEIEDAGELIMVSDTWLESTQIVSSMRLDVLVAALTNQSRQKAVNLIKGEKVRVNWTTTSDVAAELYEEDLLSIRGYGRFKILAVEGRTRKEKVRLITGQLEGL
mgnify:CR=1 FL=1